MKKGFIALVLFLSFLPSVVLAQPAVPGIPPKADIGTIKTPIPPETQKLYIWPSFDCVVLYDTYPPSNFFGGEETGIIVRDRDLGFAGKEGHSGFYPYIKKGPDFVCPIRLPADSTVTNILIKGHYESGRRTTEEPRTINVKFKVLESDSNRGPWEAATILKSRELRLSSSGDFKVSMTEMFTVKGPEILTYLWINHLDDMASEAASINYKLIVVSYR